MRLLPPLPQRPLPQGMPGPQNGIGSPAVADWWLATIVRVLEVDEENEAAAAPARTSVKAKMRTVSFIVGNPFEISDAGR